MTVSSATQAEYFVIHSEKGSPASELPKAAPKAGVQRRRSQPVESARESSRKSKSPTERGRKPSPNRPGATPSNFRPTAAAAKAAASARTAKSSPTATSRRLSEPPAQTRQARPDTSPGTRARATQELKTSTAQSLKEENENLRLKVQALQENHQWATDMHWEVIAKVIQERDKIEERCQRMCERAEELQAELEKVQGSIGTPATPIVLPAANYAADGSLTLRRFCYTPVRRFATIGAPPSTVRQVVTPMRMANGSTSVTVPAPGCLSSGDNMPPLASKLGWQSVPSSCTVAPQASVQFPISRTITVPATGVVIKTSEPAATAGSSWGTPAVGGSVALAPRVAASMKDQAGTSDARVVVVCAPKVKEDVMETATLAALPTPCRAGTCRSSSVSREAPRM
eukprot:CAMPEP_0197650172 /NCGR_PEP_ID=MMETSP1338-20131121/30781_1 /TAXON_ID=43686 ORGANISM="Pelagodinium beii, Strain RCC1491" /NCGR_SAMPLE_ID=MMETSP1338 /ASSEMBLY_ACC=CAM_ASM_000754 /LENGTH=398 /DNA_ID=CAMNT_0043224525 /DNA_START=69 /DNA_END=1265 /DNA_ORIENTATION=-